MTLGRRGDLYISEGIHGAVLHLKPGAAQLERLDPVGEFPSPQTPALSADEKILYVPDYVRGIGKRQGNFIIIPDLNRIFETQGRRSAPVTAQDERIAS